MTLTARISFYVAALLLAFGVGGYVAHRRQRECPPPAKEEAHQESASAATSASNDQAASVAEEKPKTVTIIKRVPYLLPGPGCPVGTAETIETTTTADSRIAKEATKQTLNTIAQEVKSDHEITREAVERNWSASALVGARAFELRPWYGGVLSRRLAGPLALSIAIIYDPGQPVRAGAGLTWNW